MSAKIDHNWLPEGQHWDLSIYHEAHPPVTGPFQSDAGRKIIWHTTEGRNFAGADVALVSKGSEPHILINPRTGMVKQYIPFNRYARSLEHPAGTPETNRAHCIQIEIVGYAEDADEWALLHYLRLGALAELVRHRTGVPTVAPCKFGRSVPRVSAHAFIGMEGHLGHEHVPNQPSGHWDPGNLGIATLFHTMRSAREHYNGR